MARRSHPFPYRTRKLRFSAPMVVGTQVPVRVGRCQAIERQPKKVVFLYMLKNKVFKDKTGEMQKQNDLKKVFKDKTRE